jgi:DNA-binding CsgD family transcriptional regulator
VDTAMRFELTMRLLFGDKAAHQIAGLEADPKRRRAWLQKAIRKLMHLVDGLDTTLRHKKIIMAELEAMEELLKESEEASWDIVYRLLRLSLRLLGFDQGAKCHTPVYFQTLDQHFITLLLSGGDVREHYNEKKNAITIRESVVKGLRAQGLDDFKISLVLNISEYEVKKLRLNSARKPTRTSRPK